MNGKTTFAELYAIALDTDVDTVERSYKESVEFRTELNKAFLGQPNEFDKKFKEWKGASYMKLWIKKTDLNWLHQMQDEGRTRECMVSTMKRYNDNREIEIEVKAV